MAEAAAAVEGGPTVQPLVVEYDPVTGEMRQAERSPGPPAKQRRSGRRPWGLSEDAPLVDDRCRAPAERCGTHQATAPPTAYKIGRRRPLPPPLQPGRVADAPCPSLPSPPEQACPPSSTTSCPRTARSTSGGRPPGRRACRVRWRASQSARAAQRQAARAALRQQRQRRQHQRRSRAARRRKGANQRWVEWQAAAESVSRGAVHRAAGRAFAFPSRHAWLVVSVARQPAGLLICAASCLPLAGGA